MNLRRTQIAAATLAAMACLASMLASFATRSAQAQSAPDYAALLAAPDRSDADRQADKRRNPVPFLQFADPRPGMKVLLSLIHI